MKPSLKKHSQNQLSKVQVSRFGNYLAVSGLRGNHESIDELNFNSVNVSAHPEFTFNQKACQHEEPSSYEFLQLYWIDDCYSFKVAEEFPVHLITINKKASHEKSVIVIQDIVDDDYNGLLEAVKMLNQDELWENRVLWEIVYNNTKGDHFPEVISTALNFLGWSRLESVAEQHLYAKNGKKNVNEMVRFQSHCIAQMSIEYMSEDLKRNFVSKSLETKLSEFDSVFVGSVITQLRRIGEDEACEFACHILEKVSNLSRENIKILMSHCLPPHSKWWVDSMLGNQYLGDEQLADAFNALGAASAAQFHAPLARACFSAALVISEKSQSAAWNAGLLCISGGDYDGAKNFLSKVSRHYPNQSAATTWPVLHGRSWPESSLDAGAFFELPDGCSEWPRISIITPSYNQGDYIEETILSIINQNYPNLQYIVVDGNSSDATHEVLEKYRPHIDHLIIEPDNGQTEAINKGFRLADGDLIAWLNSDDMYGPGSLHAVALQWLVEKIPFKPIFKNPSELRYVEVGIGGGRFVD